MNRYFVSTLAFIFCLIAKVSYANFSCKYPDLKCVADNNGLFPTEKICQHWCRKLPVETYTSDEIKNNFPICRETNLLLPLPKEMWENTSETSGIRDFHSTFGYIKVVKHLDESNIRNSSALKMTLIENLGIPALPSLGGIDVYFHKKDTKIPESDILFKHDKLTVSINCALLKALRKDIEYLSTTDTVPFLISNIAFTAVGEENSTSQVASLIIEKSSKNKLKAYYIDSHVPANRELTKIISEIIKIISEAINIKINTITPTNKILEDACRLSQTWEVFIAMTYVLNKACNNFNSAEDIFTKLTQVKSAHHIRYLIYMSYYSYTLNKEMFDQYQITREEKRQFLPIFQDRRHEFRPNSSIYKRHQKKSCLIL